LKSSGKPSCTEIREINISLTLNSTNTLNNTRNVSKKPRRVNRKWEEITAAFGFLSDTTDSSLLEMGIPDKI
jgi:hypothetical protein